MTSELPPALSAAFVQAHGAAPTLLVQAPGRVNLIGEHTDYTDGYVLPCAIGFRTWVAARPRDDGTVRVLALDQGHATDHFDLAQPITHRADAPWANYVRGVVWTLQRHGLRLRGADLAITGNVPQGAGLSSSAALEVAVAHTFKTLAGDTSLTPTQIAQLSQQAENEFVGCRSGVMDQLISALGAADKAMLIDCRSLTARPIPIPAGTAVLIAHSRVKRGLVDSAYNTRRAQCEQAAAHYGVPALRDLDEATLNSRATGLDDVTFRRARHIVTENARTLAAADALAACDLPTLSRLMAASHASMRDDFEITVPAIDQLAHILQRVAGEQGGARMTGGGFGGCVVALLPEGLVPEARAAVERGYRSPEGLPATVYVCHASAGAGVA